MPVLGKDELYTLAGDINGMLETIEKDQADIRATKEIAQGETAKLSAMISGMEEGVVFADSKNVIVEVNDARSKRIETHEVNEVLAKLLQRQPPPHHRGRRVKIKYATQASVRPPTFALFANYPKALPAHYVRFLYNGFREAWGFMGTSIRLRVRSGRGEE